MKGDSDRYMNNAKIKTAALVVTGLVAGAAVGVKIVKTIRNRKNNKKRTNKSSK